MSFFKNLYFKIKYLFAKKTKPAPNDVIVSKPSDNTKAPYPRAWLDKALEITGAFEGSGFDQVTGNFDGQGLSAGILQWNYGQGSLQNKILKPWVAKHGADELNRFFNVDVASSANLNRTLGIGFAVTYNGSWHNDWKRFLTDPRTIEIQKHAAQEVADKAFRYCQDWGVVTERAFCFFFDIVTQNGSMRGQRRPTRIEDFQSSIKKDGGKNKTRWQQVKPTDEQLILWQSIRNRVKRNRWADDVLSRKGTIIFGTGLVHGKLWRFTYS